MNILKLLVAGAAIGVILVAFRDFENESWLLPMQGGDRALDEGDEAEPILGYDGMDTDTLLDWLGDAELDRDTLLRMRRYEESHLARETVLESIDDQL